MTAAIVLESVTARYRGAGVISELSLAVEPGEILALLGPSGCGKTSLLRLILGFLTPETGVVRIHGQVVSEEGCIRVPPEERDLAVVFQDLALWPHLTVHGNLAFGLDSKKTPRKQRERRIGDMLHRVGLAGKEHRYPGELSGGERQRVAIARALVLEPRAVLLDEPLSNLDAGLKRELLGLFRQLLKERKATAIYVTHDIREAAWLGDRLAVMAEGRIIQTGGLNELSTGPANGFIQCVVEDLRGIHAVRK